MNDEIEKMTKDLNLREPTLADRQRRIIERRFFYEAGRASSMSEDKQAHFCEDLRPEEIESAQSEEPGRKRNPDRRAGGGL